MHPATRAHLRCRIHIPATMRCPCQNAAWFSLKLNLMSGRPRFMLFLRFFPRLRVVVLYSSNMAAKQVFNFGAGPAKMPKAVCRPLYCSGVLEVYVYWLGSARDACRWHWHSHSLIITYITREAFEHTKYVVQIRNLTSFSCFFVIRVLKWNGVHRCLKRHGTKWWATKDAGCLLWVRSVTKPVALKTTLDNDAQPARSTTPPLNFTRLQWTPLSLCGSSASVGYRIR